MKKVSCLLVAMFILIFILPINIMAVGKIDYEVTSFAEFKEAVREINESAEDEEYIIHLKENINFNDLKMATQEYDIHFRKNVIILGHGHTINVWSEISKGSLWIENGKTLSLGKAGLPEESKLTLTSSLTKTGSGAVVIVGYREENATFNMYEGVEITGNVTSDGSLGSAVNIVNGVFNMYGGDIHHNINKANPGVGGAVAGNVTAQDLGVYNCTFNMYGGTIRENETNSTQPHAFGGGVFLERSNFSMHGGSINDNFITISDEKAKTYGAGICISNAASDIVLDGGEISNNHSSQFGSGLYIRSSNVTIEKDFKIIGNKAKFGGGIYVGPGSLTIKNGVNILGNQALNGGGICNNDGEVMIQSGAIIANNRATGKGDDISSYGKSITLSSAKDMHTNLTTDNSNKLIDGWYQDESGKRWGKGNAVLQDVSAPIKDKVFLKAAYGTISTVIFMNDGNEYARVKVENGKTIAQDTLTDESMPVAPSKASYIFEEWNTQVDGKGTTFTGDTIVNDDMAVYAIYSKKADTPNQSLNEAPKLELRNKTIIKGEDINLMSLLVKAIDKEDGVLTDQVRLIDDGGFDKNKVGEYIITFKVMDSKGLTTQEKAKVTVVEQEIATDIKKQTNPKDLNENIQKISIRKVPKTNDSSNITGYGAAFSLSIVVFWALTLCRKNKNVL